MALATCAAPVVVLSLSLLIPAAGHGWLTEPPARNAQSGAKNGFCPHCGNGNGICGDGNQWPSGSNYVDFYSGPVKTWTAGTVVEVEVKITAHHMGHFEFSVCDQVITSSLQNPQACLDQWILERASPAEAGLTDCQPNDRRAGCQPLDDRHRERFYLPPGGFSPDGSNTHRFFLKVPSGLSCDACTLQWRWWSANSCTPASDYGCYASVLNANGYDAGSWGVRGSCPGGGCDRCGCGEEFRNCADITVLRSDGTVESTTTVGTGVVTTAPVTITTTTTVNSGGGSCVRNPDCTANAWCNVDVYLTWCPQQIVHGGSCPSPQCTSSISGTTSQQTTTTTTTPAAATTTNIASTATTTTSTTVQLGCRAVAGGEFGSTDERCAEVCRVVEEGSWPCAGQLCDCSVTSMAEVGLHSSI